MPTPSEISDIVDTEVDVETARAGRSPFSNMLLVSEFETPTAWTQAGFSRSYTYIGSAADVDDLLELHGFEEDSAARRMARSAFRQVPCPDRVTIGRSDPTDPTWAAAFDAIREENASWYAVMVDARAEADIDAIAAYLEGKFALYVLSNADADVLTASAGNILAQLKEIGYKRTVYLWHDPATASDLGPAVIYTGSAGPWDLSAHAGTVANVEINGVSAPVTFNATAGFKMGSDASPNSVAADVPGQIDIEVDDSGTTYSVPIVVTDFANAATPTAAELGAKIQAHIGASLVSAGDAGGANAGKILITSRTLGTGSQIDIKNTSTANILTAFGLTVGAGSGTGDAVDASAVTPAEIVTLFNGDLPGSPAAAVTSGEFEGFVTLSTESAEGEFATIRVLGAQLNEVLRFTSTLTRGTGTDEDYTDVAWAAGRLGGVDLDAPRPGGHITWNNFKPDSLDGRIKADRLTVAQRTNVQEQNGNTFERRSTNRTPGEIHFGVCVDGTYIDSRVGADWLAYRIAEAVQRLLDDAADATTQIDFTDEDARVKLIGAIGEVLLAADRSGLIVADLEPTDPTTGKATGLDVPFLADLTQAQVNARQWGPITFAQRRRGALHKVVIRGKLT